SDRWIATTYKISSFTILQTRSNPRNWSALIRVELSYRHSEYKIGFR
ncbi:uncharacterized protein METZ01_LOCUS235300, partial [marine metagenome]